jgi:steroid Delta-isomerase
VAVNATDGAAPARSSDARVVRVAAFFDALASPDDLRRLPEVYADDALFEDPFNRVRGRDAITRVFAHMYHQVDEPRFEMLETIAEGDSAFFVWHFRFWRKGAKRDNGEPIVVMGSSHVRFAADGRVAYHRDYWDPAQGIYEKLPWIGGLFRAIRRAGSAGA